MALKITGSITIGLKPGEFEQDIVISSSDFSLEEAGVRHIGDGEYQYEAMYVYHGDEFEVSFEASNDNGSVYVTEYKVSGGIEIIEDDLDIKALDYEVDDYF